MRYIFAFLLILLNANFAYGYITQNIPNGCEVTNLFRPVFERNTYVCANGYFLPANGTACVACPVDATCPGGTFEFNDTTPQGIVINNHVTHNLNNVCGAERRFFRPVFVPNTINIIWRDANNADIATNDAAVTVYDGDIRTPANPPHIPGKIFTGWKFTPN